MTLHRALSTIPLMVALVGSVLAGCAQESPEDVAPQAEESSDEASELVARRAKPARPRPEPDAGATARCGTRGGIECGAGQFCDRAGDPLCGATDRGGVCKPRPQACTKIYQPVCGCDGRTYGNACEANAAGMSVAKQGACTAPTPPTKKMCGGFAGLACEAGQFCNYEPAAGGQGCEGIADAAGVCETTPRVCTREYRPVCGCDRRTYATACTAHAAGASVLRQDACTELDCAAIGGKVVNGIGPAPECPAGTEDHGPVRYSNGQVAIEGAICCLPK